ncbi:hypothetical protein EUGRSUZ_H02635 [Eucalyptus grandis]|uniref:Uncharacterized protein n=2 Tax=Eucalyptus grandis TaxID=71139 RepID=A0A059B214_EUCGR|nr:hypothetical protein EUGRSUZ_H02635 [Eucalyptus grandis]
METPRDSPKRKRPSSSLFAPLFSLFTRSEAPAGPRRKLPRRSLLPDADGGGGGCSGSARVSTKDLRSRRVFSLGPKPRSTGFGPDRGEGKLEELDSPCGEEGGAGKDDVSATLSSIVREYCSEEDGGRDLYKDDDDDETSEEEDDEGLEKADLQAERDAGNDEESSRMPPDSPEEDVAATETVKGSDDSGDDCVRTTPPEATDVILSPDAGENGGTCDLRRADRLLVEPLQGSSQDEGSGAEIRKRDDPASKVEPGLNPRLKLRRRIYQRPGSISYRRLLPYLTDMAMEDSGTARVSGSEKHEKVMEEKPPLSSISSSYKDIPMDESSEHGSDVTATIAVPLVIPTVDKDRNCPDTPAMVNKELGHRDIDGQIDSGRPESIVQGSTLCGDSTVRTHTDDVKTIEKGEAEVVDGRPSGMADDLDSVKSVSSMSKEENVVDHCFHEQKHPMDGGMTRFQPIAPHNSSSGENGYSLFTETRGSDRGEISNQMIDTNEARSLIPSSDSGIFGESGVNEIECNKIKFVTSSANEMPQNSPSKISKAGYSIPDKNSGNSTKNKMVLNPCSRLKVFKNPNSLSYKRMLPYLMEIAKDDSCTPGNGQCLKLLTRSKEESSSPPVLSDFQNFPTDKCNGDQGSADLNISSPESVAHGTCLQKDEDILAKNVTQSTDSTHESSYGIVNARDEGHLQAASSFSIAVHQSKEDSHTILCQSPEHGGELHANSAPELSSDAKEIGAEGPMQNLSQIGASDLFGFPDEAPRRGILKRNPRGCRGLCSCLTCASFRLNAERAFEFSRNQMKDAEEMTFNLINQLSQLRSIVEKINCGVINLAVPQVREACRRASEAEELAKCCLSEMNDELNIHCRVVCLHRPRVTFNDCTENGTIHEEQQSKES